MNSATTKVALLRESDGAAKWLECMALITADNVDRLWRDQTMERRGLALAEEAGEVCRAILKRSDGHRGDPAEWTANLRTEIGQVVMVAIDIAYREGFSLAEVVAEAVAELVVAVPKRPVAENQTRP